MRDGFLKVKYDSQRRIEFYKFGYKTTFVNNNCLNIMKIPLAFNNKIVSLTEFGFNRGSLPVMEMAVGNSRMVLQFER